MKLQTLFLCLFALLLAILALFLLSAKSDARWANRSELRLDHEITSTLFVQDSLAIASEFWGSSCSEYHVYLVPSLPGDERAVSTVGVPCFAWMSEAYVQDSMVSRVERCYDIVHEFGHWTGHGHSTNPYSVMWPGPWATVRGCFERFVPPSKRSWYRSQYDPVWATK